MLVGIGIGTAMAKNGVAAQAFTHILYKALLLMAAGAVLQATGRRSLADVGGLARSMPWTALLAVVGVLSMAAPLTLGFVSKSMIAQAAGDQHRIGLWLALAAASAGVFVAVGLRFVWFTFFGPDSGLRPADPPIHMRLAMLMLALLCVGLGVWYEPLYRMLRFRSTTRPTPGTHVVAQLQLLLGAALVFSCCVAFLAPARTITLDVDWLYRRALRDWARRSPGSGTRLRTRGTRPWRTCWIGAATGVRRMHGPEGLLARTWSVRSMGLWMLAMLLGPAADRLRGLRAAPSWCARHRNAGARARTLRGPWGHPRRPQSPALRVVNVAPGARGTIASWRMWQLRHLTKSE